jgi:F-box protein 11
VTYTPRDVLIEIVAKHGDSLLTSPLRTEALLKDYCGEFRREIFVLVSCLRAGVIDQLRRQSSGPSVKLVCARLALKLEQNLAISSDVAKWAVESWAIALGLLLPQNATTRLSDFVDIASRLGQVPPVPQLPAQQVEQPGQETPPAETETTGHDAATSVQEEPPVEFLAEEPEPGWPVPDWSRPVATIVVFPDSSGQRPTLREALREAKPNTCLLLKPGLYHESLVIKKDVQIRAEGAPREVTIESLASSVVTLEGACLYLARLTLKGIGGKDKKTLPAVEVKSGRLEMEDCDLTSDISSVMEVKGERSEVVLRRCHLHDGKAGGIVFTEDAVGYLEECHLYQNKLSHVVIGKGCSPTLFSCKISHALMAGVYISEGGEGFIENCDIWGNAVGGVQIRRGGNPRFRHSRISANERYGILVTEQGEGLFENCQVFDNARMGVTISQQSKPRFSSCQVFDNHAEGVEISLQGEGELLDCEVFSNGEANVLVKDKSTPQLYRCVIHDGEKAGLIITGASEGRFEQCEFFGNTLAAVSVAQNSKPVFRQCVLHHGNEGGISVLGAEGQFIDCEITHHAGTALFIGAKAQPRFERCHVVNNQGVGIHIDDASTPALLNCVVRENGGTGVLCTQNSTPRMIEGEISGNVGGGLLVTSQGKGRFEQLHFLANKCDALLVSDGGRPSLRLCRIEESESAGMRFLNLSHGTIEEVDIIGGIGPGIEIEGGATPSFRQVSVTHGKGAGIVVQPFGGGTADHCVVASNAGGDWSVAENARIVRIGC